MEDICHVGHVCRSGETFYRYCMWLTVCALWRKLDYSTCERYGNVVPVDMMREVIRL
jgi:hypothetical protein